MFYSTSVIWILQLAISVVLTVSFIAAEQSLAPCPQTPYFRCANGRCIPKAFLCDDDNDCYDNSDEKNCHCPGHAPIECSDGTCIRRSWLCDGDHDCSDDEENCQSAKSTTSSTNGTIFEIGTTVPERHETMETEYTDNVSYVTFFYETTETESVPHETATFLYETTETESVPYETTVFFYETTETKSVPHETATFLYETTETESVPYETTAFFYETTETESDPYETPTFLYETHVYDIPYESSETAEQIESTRTAATSSPKASYFPERSNMTVAVETEDPDNTTGILLVILFSLIVAASLVSFCFYKKRLRRNTNTDVDKTVYQKNVEESSDLESKSVRKDVTLPV